MKNTSPHTFFADLVSEIEIPDKGILSRTIFKDEALRVVLFGFAAGEELSEHTASKPAVLHLLKGNARITLGEETVEAQPGTWIHMPANLKHSLHATGPCVLLLTLVG